MSNLLNSQLHQQSFCPVCNSSLLRHFNKGSIVLFCTSCRQEFSAILVGRNPDTSTTKDIDESASAMALADLHLVEPTKPLQPPAVAQ